MGGIGMVVGAGAVVLKRRSSPKSEMSERDDDRLSLWKIGAMLRFRGGTSSWGNVMELLFGELLGDGFRERSDCGVSSGDDLGDVVVDERLFAAFKGRNWPRAFLGLNSGIS
jgi:hypothetical protein